MRTAKPTTMPFEADCHAGAGEIGHRTHILAVDLPRTTSTERTAGRRPHAMSDQRDLLVPDDDLVEPQPDKGGAQAAQHRRHGGKAHGQAPEGAAGDEAAQHTAANVLPSAARSQPSKRRAPRLILVAKSKYASYAACSITFLKGEMRVGAGRSPRSQLTSCMTLTAVAMATCPRCVLRKPT